MRHSNPFLLFALSIFCLVEISAADTTSTTVAYPKQHRGFYNSFNVGVSYIDYKMHNDDFYDYEKVSFNGWGFPFLEYRFGVGLANLLALYTQFNFVLHVGSNEQKQFECDRDGLCSIDEDDSYSETLVLGRTYVGFGASLYPFRDTSSVMNGFFIGGSSGYSMESQLNAEYSIDFAFTVELGKEWWVNDQHSLGVSVAYFHAFPQYEVKKSKSSINGIQLMFRMRRG